MAYANLSQAGNSSQRNNEPENAELRPGTEYLVFAPALGIVMLVAIFGNMTLIVTIYRTASLRTRTNMFILNQACADVGVALLCMPFSIVTCFTRDWVLGDGLCQLNGFMYILFEASSLFTLTAISIEKYFSIVKPLAVVITTRLTWIMISMTWFTALVLATIPLTGFITFVYKPGSIKCSVSVPESEGRTIYAVVMLLVAFLIPLCIMGFCYINIFRVARKHNIRLSRMSLTSIESEILLTSQKQIALTIFVMLIVFIICWTPFFSFMMYMSIHHIKIPNLTKPALAIAMSSFLLLALLRSVGAETCARHPSFPPPFESPADTARWFREQLPELPVPPKPSLCGEKCAAHARWSAVEYMAARKSGQVTCEEYAASLILRAKHYRDMNQFMNWDNDPQWTDRVLDAARALDLKAAREGIEAIAPLYGLPIPMKGTMATVDFISSAGVSLLHDFRAKDDADFVKLVKAKHGVVYGKTNVPEFAASLVTCNPANGCTLNPHGRHLTSGGSSGGAASAVATFLAPVAVSEDTGGSTRSPAFSNGNFGYDPTRNHYPNAGNPGMALILDQLGLNARSIEDIIALDGVFCGYDPNTVKSKKIGELRIGVPQYPYVEAYVPAGGDNPFNFSVYPKAYMPSRQIMKKYKAAKAALHASGAAVVEKEWPMEGDTNILAKAFFLMKMGDEVVSPYWHVFHTYMGQVSQWINDYLGAPGITISDVVAAAQPAGIGHDPAKIMQANTSEEKLAFVIQELRQAGVAAWNRLFDEEKLDLILIPGFLHTATFECMASSTCEHQVKNLITGEVTTEAKFASLDNLFMHSFSMKHMPLPKMMVPVGLDDEGKGNPVGLQFLGRAGPPKSQGLGYSYDSKLLKVVDAPFLKAVQVAVDAMVKQDPSLARVEPQLVKGLENLFQ